MLVRASHTMLKIGARGVRAAPFPAAMPAALWKPAAAAACPYSSLTAATAVARRQPASSACRRPVSVPVPAPAWPSAICRAPIGRRSASTASTSSPPKPTDPSSASSPPLDWNTFFRMRKTRRRFQVASSILTTMAGGGGGAMLLANQDIEWLLGSIPLDPIFSLGLITLSFAALGWLAGPSLGNAFFYLLNRSVKAPMGTKEVEFFARIKKNRVDPSTSSVQNPVPDFYGEKISSVAGYRQWLKDQRAFVKKRTIPL